MRLPHLALLVAVATAPLSAQTARGILHPRSSNPPSTTQATPRYQHEDGYYHNNEYRVLEPRLTADSVQRIVERKYTGWFVRSKQLVNECQGAVYIFDMISAGAVGEHRLRIDGDTGEVLNPEVIGQKPDSVLVPNCGYHREATRP
jgi:hypothetical protein